MPHAKRRRTSWSRCISSEYVQVSSQEQHNLCVWLLKVRWQREGFTGCLKIRSGTLKSPAESEKHRGVKANAGENVNDGSILERADARTLASQIRRQLNFRLESTREVCTFPSQGRC